MNFTASSRKSQLLFLLILFVPFVAYSQDSTAHATLHGWEQRTINFMLDRSHNYGGTLFNRGLFRYNLNTMSPEHEIDLLTYRYTPVDDYKWMTSDHAYRSSFGSLNATHFAVENKIKNRFDINENNAININGAQEENLRASRFLFRLGYEYNFKGKQYIGGKHTFSNNKSDLDVTAYYRYGDPGDGEGMAYIGFTRLDWASNETEKLANESDNQYKRLYGATHHYKKNPNLINVRLESPELGNFRAEVRAGYQTFSKKLVNPFPDTLDYVDKEWAHYLGGLIEYSHPRGIVGFTYQRKFSKLRRQPTLDSKFKNNFTNTQFSDRGGFFITGSYHKFRLEHWMWLERNVDRLLGKRVPDDLRPAFPQDGPTPFSYVEHRLKFKSGLHYGSAVKGIQMGLEYHADYRYPEGDKDPNQGIRNYQYRLIYPTVRNRSARFTYTVGYRVSKNFFFEGGLSYDLDGDHQSGLGREVPGSQTWFDGGFGRLSIRW